MEITDRCPYNCTNGQVLMEALGQKVPCPHCNGIERYVEMTNCENPDNVYNVLRIPLQYRSLTANSTDAVISNLRQITTDGADLKEVIDVLEKMSSSLDSRKVYRLSSYISVPQHLASVDMNMFVYAMQMKAMSKGIGTMPYITANMLYLLLQGKDIAPDEVGEPLQDTYTGVNGRNTSLYTRLRYATNFDYWDYITAPLIFIEASAGVSADGWVAIADLLSERARLSLPTYVIGYWNSSVKSSGSFVYTNDMSRLDKLTVFEFNLTKSKKLMPRSISEVLNKNTDDLNEFGVKLTGAPDVVSDYRDLV